jgi:hypothetical protein
VEKKQIIATRVGVPLVLIYDQVHRINLPYFIGIFDGVRTERLAVDIQTMSADAWALLMYRQALAHGYVGRRMRED